MRITFDQLGAQPDPPPGATDIGTLIIDEEAELGPALFTYFGESDDHEAVRILVPHQSAGYVERKQVLGHVPMQYRGTAYGASAGAFLPGLETSPAIHVRCPVRNCPLNPISVIAFDPEYPPHCPEHPEHALELAP